MHQHLNIFVEENFPDISKMDASFYPSDEALSSIMYRLCCSTDTYIFIRNEYSVLYICLITKSMHIVNTVNAIRDIFPDAIIYLCTFHRLQAWLWWLVNTKNGLANYKDHCML